MSVRYSAFGAMAVAVGGVSTPLTRRRERGVLAVLLTAHGAPVAAERLVTEVWGENGPAQTLASLQVAVSRLRSQLEPGRKARQGSCLVSTAAGYALVAATEEVDTWAFESLADAALAAGTGLERLRLADQARALWTSAPYADTDTPAVRSETSRLEELRLTLEEVRARALLDLGRPEEASRALSELAPQHPYRERVWSLLALAQYQCSRQAEALDTLRRLRERLADELGVDPSTEVQQLEQAVLRQEPRLSAPPVAPPAPTASPAPTGSTTPEPAPGRAAGAVTGGRGGGPGGTVGRDRVLSQGQALIEECVSSGSSRFLLAAGEPGIGKSRMVGDLGSRAAAQGVRVLVGRCHEEDYAPALWPWLAIVRGLHGSLATGDRPGDPLLQPLLDETVRPTDASSGTGLRMFDAVVALVERAAREQPLLVVLEDIHWADASSLRLLRHLAGADLRAPVAVVCTRRTTETGTSEALVDTMAALARAGAERVRLDGLDTGAVGSLLESAVGAHEPRLDAFVTEVTGGNPFFVLQYARLLAGLPDLDRVELAALPVPDGIRDVLHQRIRRLPEEAVQALTSAAVLGGFIDPDVLAELTGTPLEDCLDLLDLAMTSGLVEEHATGYAFVHALARETLYAEVSAARRMRLHDRAARTIEQRRAGAGDADASAVIAHHAHLAAPLGPGHAARACDWLERAAVVAAARHAHPEALHLWQLVLTDAPADSETSAMARCGEAAALLRLARTSQARDSIDRAVRLARSLGRWDLVARAAAILNGAGVWSWREHGWRDDEFIAILTEATEHVEPTERARLLATLQMEHYYGWDSSVADRLGAESVELARDCGDRALLLEVLLVRIIATWGPERAPMRLELIEEVLAAQPDGELRVFILFQLGTALYEVFEPDRADATMQRCADEAEALRHTGVEIPLAWWRFARARDLDDPRAGELGLAALALHRATGYIAGADLEILEAIRAAVPGAAVPPAVVERARASNPGLRAMVAHALLEGDDPGTARDLLGEPAPPGASEYSVLAGHCLTVLVLAETGTRAEVQVALDRITAYAGQAVTYGTVDHLGSVDHFLACGYAALGDPRAREHAERAVVLSQTLQCHPWRRRADALLARLS